jgi:hypothetical protein
MELKLILTLQRETRGKPSSTFVGDKDLSAMVLRWRKSSKQPKEKGGIVLRLMNHGKLDSLEVAWACRSLWGVTC